MTWTKTLSCSRIALSQHPETETQAVPGIFAMDLPRRKKVHMATQIPKGYYACETAEVGPFPCVATGLLFWNCLQARCTGFESCDRGRALPVHGKAPGRSVIWRRRDKRKE